MCPGQRGFCSEKESGRPGADPETHARNRCGPDSTNLAYQPKTQRWVTPKASRMK